MSDEIRFEVEAKLVPLTYIGIVVAVAVGWHAAKAVADTARAWAVNRRVGRDDP